MPGAVTARLIAITVEDLEMDELKQELLALIEQCPRSWQAAHAQSELAETKENTIKAIRSLVDDGLIRHNKNGFYERVESPESPQALSAGNTDLCEENADGAATQETPQPSIRQRVIALIERRNRALSVDFIRAELDLSPKQVSNAITQLRALGTVVPAGWEGRKQLYALNDGRTREAAPRVTGTVSMPPPMVTPAVAPKKSEIHVKDADEFRLRQANVEPDGLAIHARLRTQEREARALLRGYIEQLGDSTLNALIAVNDAAIDARESWEKTHAD